MSRLPLNGRLMVELCSGVARPYAGEMPVPLGATVIEVEPPRDRHGSTEGPRAPSVARRGRREDGEARQFRPRR